MATTGRTRTVTATGDFTGQSEIEFHIYSGMGAGPPAWLQNLVKVEFEFLGCVVRLATRRFVTRATPPQQQFLDLSCYTGHGFGIGASDTDTLSHDFDTGIPASLTWLEPLTGSFTITGEMEETINFTGSGYPTYGGVEVPDPPATTFTEFLDRLVVGSTLSVSASVATMNVSASTTVDAARQALEATRDYPFRVEVIAEGRGRAASGIGLSNIRINLGGNNGDLTGNYYQADADHSATVGGPDGKIFASATAGGKKTLLNTVVYPAVEIDFGLTLRAMENAYPGSAKFRVDEKFTDLAHLETMSDGSVLAIRQEKHSMSCGFYQWPGGGFTPDLTSVDMPTSGTSNPTELIEPVPPSLTVDERTPFRLWLDREWIDASGEQQNDWRVLLRGRPFHSFDLVQASQKTVTSTVASGTGASDLTISLPTGTTDAGLQGTLFTGASLRGYRYLRVRMKASTNETVTVSIGGKTWNADKAGAAFALTTSYADFDLDLCSPTTETASVDDTDTFFPLPTVDGEYWGVSAASSIVIGSISGGVTVDVESIKVETFDYSRATFLQCFPEQWIPAGDSSEYPVRFLDGDTDGRRSLEGIHFYRPAGGGTPVIRGLSDLIGSINGAGGTYPSDGWTATAETVFPDTYHTNNLPACFAWGAGAKTNGFLLWSYGFDQDASTSLSVYAQALHDSLSVPPLWGDGFFYINGGYSGQATVRAAKILRSQIIGLVLGDDSLPENGVTVTVNGGTDGTAITTTNGSYQTGLPYPKGGPIVDVEAEAGDSPFPSGSCVAVARRRERMAFRVVNTPTGGGFVYCDWHGQTHVSNLRSDGLRYYRSDTSLPYPGWAVNGALVTTNADERGVMCRNWQDRMVLLYGFGGDTYETISDDDGETWSTPTVAISGGTHAFTKSDRNGNQIEAAYVGGNIFARFRAAGDTAWSSLFAFVDNTTTPLVVTNAAFSFDAAQDRPERWVGAWIIDGETETSLWWSADENVDGAMSWTRVT